MTNKPTARSEIEALRAELAALHDSVKSLDQAEIIGAAVARAVSRTTASPSIQNPPQPQPGSRINAAARLLRALGSAARFPCGAGLVGAPIAFFLGKVTLPLMMLGMLAGGIFGLAALFFGYVADLTEETSS